MLRTVLATNIAKEWTAPRDPYSALIRSGPFRVESLLRRQLEIVLLGTILGPVEILAQPDDRFELALMVFMLLQFFHGYVKNFSRDELR